jgi:immunity protein 52 of polymorphic toxin system
MNTSAFNYTVRLPFAARLASPEWLGSKFLATLDALTQIDSNIFPDWEVGDLPAMKGYPLAAARSRIHEFVSHDVDLDDFRPDPESGYAAVARTTIDARSRRMTFTVYAWTRGNGNVLLAASEQSVRPDPEIVTYPLFRAALLAINAIWQQSWGCVQAFRMDYNEVPLYSGAALFPYSCFHIPWIAYLSAPLTAGLELPSEIMTEHTPDGGLLITATENRFDPTNPEHQRRARILAETLIARTGYLPGRGPRV